jgi:hypothetical protein
MSVIWLTYLYFWGGPALFIGVIVAILPNKYHVWAVLISAFILIQIGSNWVNGDNHSLKLMLWFTGPPVAFAILLPVGIVRFIRRWKES